MNSIVGGFGGLYEIKDDALSEDRVEKAIDDSGDSRLLHDIPGQEFVITIDQPVIVAFVTDQTFQPPVRSVQAVGVVGETQPEAGIMK